MLHQSPHSDDSGEEDEVHWKEHHENASIGSDWDINAEVAQGKLKGIFIPNCFAEYYFKGEGNYAAEE